MSDTPRNLADAIDQLESQTNEHAKSPIEVEIEKLQKTINEIREKARRSVDEGVDSAKDLGREVDRKVHENPWMAIGIVAFVAFFVGLLIGRKD